MIPLCRSTTRCECRDADVPLSGSLYFSIGSSPPLLISFSPPTCLSMTPRPVPFRVCLCESFVASLTTVLPHYPTGTMERVTAEGEVETANTLGKLFSNLASTGKPARLMVYDLHTLHNRFYMANNCCKTLHSAFPLHVQQIRQEEIPSAQIDCVAFPDEGAEMRFSVYFKENFPEMEMATCSKKRSKNDPSKRGAVIKNGFPQGEITVTAGDLWVCKVL